MSRSVCGAIVLAALVAVGGCASLPDSSTPQAIGTINRDSPGSSVAAPAPGREPDLLLRDFFKASTDPTDRHLSARQFLTAGVSGSWDDAASATIVDKVDVLPETRSTDKATYTIRANKVGQLEPGGLYVAEEGSFETKISLELLDGEWRISELPAGVILDRAQFLNTYQRKSLYFLDPAGTTVVPDPRWVSGPQDQMASQLISLLIDGPKAALAPAVRNELAGVSVRGPITKADGRTAQVGVGLGGIRIDFTGVPPMDEQAKQLFAAQVIWTLANAEISGPYVLLADGEPFDERFPNGWTTADVASMNPFATSSATVGLHALREGSLVSVTETGVTPVPGYFGSARNMRSLALSQDGKLVAAVADTGRPAPEPASSLMVGAYEDGAASVLEGGAITRPTWAPDNSAIWAAVNGNTVIRVLREPGTGRTSVVNVDAGAVTALGTTITELRLSRDGVRAALIVDGKVYLAIVTQMPGGEYALTNPRAVAIGLGSPALSLDWSTSDTIVVARAASDIPVVQVAVDGSRMDALPSRNLTAPVVSVDASTTTEFVADSRAVFQLNNNDPAGDRYWREVPGLTGVKAIPILPG
ncbi:MULTISPECIES: MtrAB system accessory lipoprotein LpqB [unclassified Rhodococcus (in: high G+C Gram-positive bacteria)]|uniref:MtrAB system accessory lipoprotein LpqB n=1 Tax=unclassified Rhodococcus (in: high G+C Gram-positive bacteria) TaxID=192944 RepID=UPI001639749F|nr:MtrAB system accessory protein LpqB [Rhodococcus sp. 3A]MBC2891727.1 MtrAB system accessory protein LpqB [Rhodococcus sp. 4CII]